MGELIPYACILSAKQGHFEAMSQILQHYRPYINEVSQRQFFDCYGNRYQFIDQDIRQRIESKLMYKIIYDFDPQRQPRYEYPKD